MRHGKILLCLAGVSCVFAGMCGDLRTRVLQPPYAKDAAGVESSFRWLLDGLERCDDSLDLIVLPEFSDVPGRTKTKDEYLDAVKANNARLLAACAETAKRCRSILFVNAIHETPAGIRNTTYAYDRMGNCIGHYYKRHVTAGERDQLGFDVSYTREWSEPYMLEIEGVKFAFLTCYDFYFFEAFGNIARYRPDVVIGCSLQRSDRLDALEFINAFCAYNTGAYLVRASVSMGEDSEVGGSSMVVSPTGKILGNMRSRVGDLDVTFDPSAKYLKPAGFGNPPNTHPAYVEIGRRPWQYRPGGSAIVPPFAEAAPKRLCAVNGVGDTAFGNVLAALGAAVAIGASEIAFDLSVKADGTVSTDTGVPFEAILRKLSCHAIMNIRLLTSADRPWTEVTLRKVLRAIDAYDARKHVYFTSENDAVQDQLAKLAPDIPRCMRYDESRSDRIVERALAHKCQMVQLVRSSFNRSTVDRARAAGLRCAVLCPDDPSEAKKFLEMGIGTILVNDYPSISRGTGLK